ncbi:hypothetical protein COU78_05460 [Candidatus Peregrinibacteria bacterium CG10_big_fil_rev_8_21_14_0_10_49_24]|nr:MAG: hypothetical protein COV83_03245 [Candidatus Peregrinibacteria bacterium CG11_big_fil_rev_8_21_14_0_20_49_14]PIR50575.1 MAG: hypothetical protein COU78_05460 [Candidatus Peregrinibacteria bacterium CG10_big_fil_rev_8_21_14_0_10_49_24]PJA67106.1 MAG: hypothetical protein CO157_06645 [Candidatus Peregrinibacteria bacterium CG_4_9_14_3_um_filter_49_12]
MRYFFTALGSEKEARLLNFMGAGGGPEMRSNTPEPIDTKDVPLNDIEQSLAESEGLLESIDENIEGAADVIADRVEDMAKVSQEASDTAVQRTNEYLLDQVEGGKRTIQVLIAELLDMNADAQRNVEEQRNVNVTDPRAEELSRQGLSMSEMSLRLTELMGRQVDKHIATGGALDAALEDQEGTGRSKTWHKVEGGTEQQKEAVTQNQRTESATYVPDASLEQPARDILLAMQIAEGNTTGDVNGPEAYRQLAAQFTDMEPEDQKAFITWMNDTIGSLPYEATSDIAGTLHIDRTA